jgi:hypothetical protein
VKQILIIKDPDNEVGFDVLTNYAAAVQARLGNSVFVLPMWPHGEAELLGDKRKMKLAVKEFKEILEEYDDLLEGELDEDRDFKN